MLNLALMLSMGFTQDLMNHLSILQTVNTFTTHIANQDVDGMAACLHLVYQVDQESEQPSPARIIGYGKRWCRYLLIFQRYAQTISSKYGLVLESAMPKKHEVLPWKQALYQAKSIRSTRVMQFPCREYHFTWRGHPMSQRFVQINGRWFLASPPYSEVQQWDETVNYKAVFAISALAVVEMPRYFEQAIEMAELDKSKTEVVDYLKRHYLYRDEQTPTPKLGLPTPPRD